MSNPQIISLDREGYLPLVQDDIRHILTVYSSRNRPLCSHEILGLANLDTILAIAKTAKPQSGGYSVPSGWIGSVAAHMAGQGLIGECQKECEYSKGQDHAWYITTRV